MSSMKYLIVEAIAEIASYRIPEYHNFHKTLPLPPPTTLIGVFGAALGLSAEKAQAFFDEHQPYWGLYGTYKGKYSDLWKIRSTKANTESSVIKREYLFGNHYWIVLGSTDSIIENVYQAFDNLGYPLSAGNSDSLMKILKTEVLSEASLCEAREFSNCVLLGDYRSSLKLTLDRLEPNKAYVFDSLMSPVSYNLPLAFDYDESGRRSIRMRNEVTFIQTRVELNSDQGISAISYEGKQIPLFRYNE